VWADLHLSLPALPLLDFEPVRLVVLQQQRGQVAQGHDTDAFLGSTMRPRLSRQGLERRKIRLASHGERLESFAQRQ
jgi:hypothetical protein